MRFTQTGDYLGLLPWFLIPLPLMFRRDRYTWFFTALLAATLIMALGKYTFVYRFMFEHLPAFSKFRVPKMILFLFAFGAAVLAGRGVDLLAEGAVTRKKGAWWLGVGSALVALVGLLWLFLSVGASAVFPVVEEIITIPTRYQSGGPLIQERYTFMVRETAMAFAFGCLYLALFFTWFKKWLPGKILLPLLAIILLGDLWRVNDRFLVLTTPPPAKTVAVKNDVIDFLQPRMGQYRMQPLNDENAHFYADHGFPNVSAYVTISERRYKEFLEAFSLMNTLPDLMNLKYVVMPRGEFEAEKAVLSQKYQPVLHSNKGYVVLENKTVLPKAWLVPSVVVVPDGRQRLSMMNSSPEFIPARVALVESPPPVQMAQFPSAPSGTAAVNIYTPNRIVVQATVVQNSLLVIGEKYYRWWYAYVDGTKSDIVPVDHVLRGVYLTPGNHTVEFVFDPLSFKAGKYLTITSLIFFMALFGREWWLRRKQC